MYSIHELCFVTLSLLVVLVGGGGHEKLIRRLQAQKKENKGVGWLVGHFALGGKKIISSRDNT